MSISSIHSQRDVNVHQMVLAQQYITLKMRVTITIFMATLALALGVAAVPSVDTELYSRCGGKRDITLDSGEVFKAR